MLALFQSVSDGLVCKRRFACVIRDTYSYSRNTLINLCHYQLINTTGYNSNHNKVATIINPSTV